MSTLVGPPACPDPDGAGDDGADWDIGAEDGGDAEEAELDEQPPTSAAAATIASTGNRWITITAYPPDPIPPAPKISVGTTYDIQLSKP